jgi:UDP-N-acetylglucosamine transferase subunit ALG13
MIFVTVGTQLPFDRMIHAIDEWAGRRGCGGDVFAQIGPSEFTPKHIRFSAFITAEEFVRRTRQARAIVAHAGMGSIITALEMGKPILVMPRKASLGEQRNEHQLATAKHFLAQGRISVAFDEQELLVGLDKLDELCAAERIEHRASPRLLRALRKFAGRAAAVAVGAEDRDARDERAFQHDDFTPEPAFAEPAAVASPRGS